MVQHLAPYLIFSGIESIWEQKQSFLLLCTEQACNSNRHSNLSDLRFHGPVTCILLIYFTKLCCSQLCWECAKLGTGHIPLQLEISWVDDRFHINFYADFHFCLLSFCINKSWMIQKKNSSFCIASIKGRGKGKSMGKQDI